MLLLSSLSVAARRLFCLCLGCAGSVGGCVGSCVESCVGSTSDGGMPDMSHRVCLPTFLFSLPPCSFPFHVSFVEFRKWHEHCGNKV